jgi:hypothetical protein
MDDPRMRFASATSGGTSAKLVQADVTILSQTGLARSLEELMAERNLR